MRQIDVEDKRESLVDVDAALEYLNNEDTTGMTAVDEKKLLRKIDWMIVPLDFPSTTLWTSTDV